MTAVRIIGTGSALPAQIVTNNDLIARGVNTEDAWIIERTGIRARHLAENETSGDLGFLAAQNALKMAKLSAADIDLIIVATSTPDFIFPSTACLIQNRLENHTATAFDVQAVCCGFIYALTIAEKFLASGSHQTALVIGAEVFSRIMDWNERSTCVLFGDGAGSVVLKADNSAQSGGILASSLHADGAYSNILNVPGQIKNGNIFGDPFLRMDGQAVFRFAVKALSSVAQEVCEKAGITTEQIDYLIPHQANIRIIEAVGKRLKLPAEKVIVTLENHGNTSAASVPLALDVAVRSGKIQTGNKVLLQAVGGGFTWGAVLVEF